MEFVPFPKIPRLKRDCVITEKIDGTNAQIALVPIAKEHHDDLMLDYFYGIDGSTWAVYAGSRQRWITPGRDTDNFGFATWVKDNLQELKKLGPGHHFGEWYGAGIQRTYGLTDRRFALFNTARWNDQNPNRPACCEVVPVLYQGPLGNADQVVEDLKRTGSRAVPGFMDPEGVVVCHMASGQLFKTLIEGDDRPKSAPKEKVARLRDPNTGARLRRVRP